MNKDADYYKVCEELKQLRLLEKNISVLSKAIDKYDYESFLLDSLNSSDNLKAHKTSGKLKSLIIRSLEIKQKYYPVIAELEPLDRIIILKGFIDKTPYKKLGKEIGYSKEGIQKRICMILDRINRALKTNQTNEP